MRLKPFHPLSQGLIMSLFLNENGGNIVYDATGNQNHGTGTNIAWGRDGLDLPGTNEHISIPNFIGQNDDWTIFTSFTQDVRNPDSQSWSTALAAMQDGTGIGRLLLAIDDKIIPSYKLTSKVDGSGHDATTTIDVGTAYTAGLTQEGTSFHFYLNGKDDGNFVASADPANGNIILFDTEFADGNGCLDGTSGVFHWYNRPLSAKEMMLLDHDSFGMFEPEYMPSRYHCSGYTIIAEPGQFGITGQNIELKKDSKLLIDSGEYNISGSDAELPYAPIVSYTIGTGSGAYIITQFDGDVAYALTPDGGQIAYAGGQPVMDAGGLENAVNISLFTDSLEWWANALNENEPDKQIGSDFEERIKPKAINTAYLRDVEDAAKDALQWMINLKIAQTVEAIATWPELNIVNLEILITKPGGNIAIFRHEFNWKSGLFYPVTAKAEGF